MFLGIFKMISKLDLNGEWTSVAAPATIANVGPAFDVLGIAVRNIEDVDRDRVTYLGDVVHIRRTQAGRSLTIRGIYVNGISDPTLTSQTYLTKCLLNTLPNLSKKNL